MTAYLCVHCNIIFYIYACQVDLIQPDVMWMGGPTEFARIVALAYVLDLQQMNMNTMTHTD